MSDPIYTVSWHYETAVQDMDPQEAAALATSVFLSGGDPAAPKGFNEFSVSVFDGTEEVQLGEHQVEVKPTYDQLRAFAAQVAAYTKDGEPKDDAEDEDDTFVLENDDAFDTVMALITEARDLFGIDDPPEPERDEDGYLTEAGKTALSEWHKRVGLLADGDDTKERS